MTSSSRSDGAGGRNLAVFRTPAPPEGWHGRDLVRLVDPAGLSVAWLSARHAGAVIAFGARDHIDDAWQPLLHANDSRPAAHVAIRSDSGDAPLAEIGVPWTMTQRDPTSASFACAIVGYCVTGSCESGELRMTASVPLTVRGSLTFVVEGDKALSGEDFAIEGAVGAGSLDLRIRRASIPVESDLSATFPQER
jgi:hypothetical protein